VTRALQLTPRSGNSLISQSRSLRASSAAGSRALRTFSSD
jgi:hypothetical protein